jgi:hypothetical protein
MRSGSTSPGAGGNEGPGEDEAQSTEPAPSGAAPASGSVSVAGNQASSDSAEDDTTRTRVRPTRLTPGAAGLAALIAQSRTKFGRKNEGRTTFDARHTAHLTPRVDTAEITAVGGLFRSEKAQARDTRIPASSRSPVLTPLDEDPEDSGPTEQLTPIFEEFDGSDVTATTTAVDLIGQRSGQESAQDEATAARVPRPMRLTPGGSARLAALLGQSRAKPEARGSPDVRTVDEVDTPSTSFVARSFAASAAVKSVDLETDIPEPQEKNPKFAATLHGVSVPEITVPAPWGTSAKQRPAESFEHRDEAPGAFGRGRHFSNVVLPRDISNQQTLGGFGNSPTVPLSVDEAEPTVRNPSNAATPGENRPLRRSRIAIGAAMMTALVVLGVGIVLSRPKVAEDSSRPLTDRPSAAAPPAAVKSRAEIVKIEPPQEPLPPASDPARAMIAPDQAKVAPEADSPLPANKTLAEEPAAEQQGPANLKEDQGTAAKNDSRIAAPLDVGSSESKRRLGSYSESRRTALRRSSAKHRDRAAEGSPKPSESQSAASDAPAPSQAQVKDQPKTKAGSPARALEYDPDATLPLMGR